VSEVSISEYIKEARAKAGLSQAQLAQRIGASQQLVARWEVGNLAIHMKWRRLLVAVLELDDEGEARLQELLLGQFDGAA